MKHYKLLLYIIALSVMASCMRRPFGEFSTGVYIDMKVQAEVTHELNPVEKPDLMKVVLYEKETGLPVYTHFIPTEGGYIHPEPGTYDMMVYNINTETTYLENEDDQYLVEATTNNIPEFVQSQLSKFLTARQKVRMEAMNKLQESQQNANSDTEMTGTKDTKPDTKGPEERIVNEPDHIFVGRKADLVIPRLEQGETSRLVIEVKAETLVETWHVKFTNVNGVEYVTNTVGLMTGLHQSVRLWNQKKSDDQVTVYFTLGRGEDKKSLFGTFHTFGKHPAFNNGLSVDIGIMNMEGQNQVYHYDVNEQFNEQNTKHLILIDDEITIKKPEGGGGFRPGVEDWEDIETDIII